MQNEIGVYGTNFMGVFVGPQPPPASPPPPPPFCPFTSRQQVGHFLYVLDRDNRQVVIVNSNRFTVLDTIQLSDPVSMAVAPNMTRLAVSNFASSSVTFIDIDPQSATFHQVINAVSVGQGPSGIAWQPDNEDILVCNELGDFSCLEQVHTVTLGGVDPYQRGIYEAEHKSTLTTTVAVERVVYAARGARVTQDIAGGEGLFAELLGSTTSGALSDVNALLVEETLQSLYRRALLRDATEGELTELKELYLTLAENEGPLLAAEWAWLSCFATLSGAEFLMY